MRRVLVAFCLLLATIGLAWGQKLNGHHGAPLTEPCVQKVTEKTTETLLRTAFFMGDLEGATKILSTSNETFSLAAGFMYTPEEQCFLAFGQNASRDPDVVSIKAAALTAERTGETERLSTSIVASFQRLCECSLFTPRELDEMRSGIKAVLDDPVERRLILDFDGTEEEPLPPPPQIPSPPAISTKPHQSAVPSPPANPTPSPDTIGDKDDDDITERFLRRLLVTESSPTDSLYCAHCRPRRGCRPVSWC